MNLSRQSDLVKNTNWYNITLIGAGAIGSNTANVLARMGFKIKIIDPDTVGSENLAPGMFRAQIRHPKVEAVKALLVSQGVPKDNIVGFHREATGDDLKEGEIVVIGTDSLESRLSIWTGKKERPALYIDARIGGKTVTVIALSANDDDSNYVENMMGESEDLPCGSKATAYTGGLAASVIGATIAQFVQGLPYPSFTYFDMGVAYSHMTRMSGDDDRDRNRGV